MGRFEIILGKELPPEPPPLDPSPLKGYILSTSAYNTFGDVLKGLEDIEKRGYHQKNSNDFGVWFYRDDRSGSYDNPLALLCGSFPECRECPVLKVCGVTCYDIPKIKTWYETSNIVPLPGPLLDFIIALKDIYSHLHPISPVDELYKELDRIEAELERERRNEQI